MGSNKSSASKKGTRQLVQGRGEQTLGNRLRPRRHWVPDPSGLGQGAASAAQGPSWITAQHRGRRDKNPAVSTMTSATAQLPISSFPLLSIGLKKTTKKPTKSRYPATLTSEGRLFPCLFTLPLCSGSKAFPLRIFNYLCHLFLAQLGRQRGDCSPLPSKHTSGPRSTFTRPPHLHVSFSYPNPPLLVPFTLPCAFGKDAATAIFTC